MRAVEVNHIVKSYADKVAVNDISFSVAKNEIFGLIGPNGAGKTTTIRLLLGLLEPTFGRVEVLGFDSRKQPNQIRNRTGALLEYSGIYEQMSAEDNLEFYARVWRLPTAEKQVRIKELFFPQLTVVMV
jgi:ABC-2 type transport system ATP-binding protein